MSADGKESWVVVVNPVSDEGFREEVEKALQSYEADYAVQETTPDVDGEALALEAIRQGAERLLACGGDGTVKGVINGICKSRKEESDSPAATLGIVPGGTANLVATALGIPMKVSDAVAVALAGEDALIDVGRCHDHFFALGIGVGMTERLVSRSSEEEKEKLGRWAYARAMLRELGAHPHLFYVTLDEDASRRLRGVAVVLANMGDIGGKLSFAPDARLDDGLIDVGILHSFRLRDVLRLLWRSLTNRLESDWAVSFYQARKVELGSAGTLAVQIDGEEVDLTTPVTAEAVAGALRVRVPVKEAVPSESA